MSGTNGTAIESRDKILGTVKQYSEEISKLAPRGYEAAHFIASLRLYMAQNPKILDCTPTSIVQGMLRVAQTGLQLGVSCDLLPFGKTCQFSPRYSGIIELALSAGVRSINADVVREGDFFAYEKGTAFFLKHRKDGKHTNPITHAYAIAEIKQGSFVFDVLERDEIDQLRVEYSKSWKNGSLDAIPWYAKKTAVRKLSPYLPKNARLAAALQSADESSEVPTADFEVVGLRAEDEAERVDADGVVEEAV